MSHGPSSGDTIDPNLTPLLDLVLQLLMLFMICGNYASESNDPVELARSQTAQELTDSDTTQTKDPNTPDFLFITVKPYHDADGVRQVALDEIQHRMTLPPAQGGYTEGQAAHAQKVVEDLYAKLKAKESLDNEEMDLMKDLNIPANSEKDLADHLQEKTRAGVIAEFKDGDSYVIVPGEDAMKPDDSLLNWLQKKYKDLSDRNNGNVTTPVVIRPDGNMDYAVVYRILKLCKDAHFTNLKVRALKVKGIKG